MIINNILEVSKKGLCVGCGTCESVCPKNSIKMVINKKKGIYLPNINQKLCNDCELCIKSCPGYELDFNSLSSELFNKCNTNQLIGKFLDTFIGYSTNMHIRYNSSSGGMITQILISSLELGIIDGALVTRMKKGNPLIPEPFIAKTKEEIIEASKSKYCPVPLNSALNELMTTKLKKIAVVGLPCHIHGIRKAEKINNKLRKKIIIHLGIFCIYTPTFNGTKLLLKKLSLNEEKIKNIEYRGKGWPGSMKIIDHKHEIIVNEYWKFIGLNFFIPFRCLKCCDGTNELADISFGDAWLPEYSNDKIGSSIIISRTKFSLELLYSLNENNKINLNEIDVGKVIESQRGMLYFKKKSFESRIKISRNSPEYNIKHLNPYLMDYVTSIYIYLSIYLASFSIFRKLLPHIPDKILVLYKLFPTLINRKKRI
ncbi:coenzyme F420 hydrogenase/dehydrogenase beta subunit domain protein [Methanobacterium lacus]|uniref:Coenzyme F420 hydrogenase/dehydrogenase beta subunit domain protein n=1 Tax=Methanobacterium lacus (strain AL-21) TaxID=877455 RepID=F0TBN6_METLA|nr:Coenzyme F420 hydrogenase/dehydrogenase, beta subunit C-terminal domain [Methanobacterium lacus]ADZ09113.1 coenzyme F420 hydrogenase/dehydrogenase beta subunit domain protein [Methanobacterium lacus]